MLFIQIFQVIINGILLGGLYASIALGFSLVWGVMNIINVSHGALIMLGAYATYWICHFLGIDPFLSLPISMFFLFVIGYLLQKCIINLIVKAPLYMTITLTFGIEITLVQIALLLWTADYRSITPHYASLIFSFFSLKVPLIRLITFVISAFFLTLALWLFLTRTKLGMAIQATRMDPNAAKIMGIKNDRIYNYTFAISSAFAGAAGSLVGIGSVISPIMGEPYLVKSFVICVLGGLGSIPGVLLGGVVLGVLEALSITVVGPAYKDVPGYIILVGILIMRPQGLVGKKYY